MSRFLIGYGVRLSLAPNDARTNEAVFKAKAKAIAKAEARFREGCTRIAVKLGEVGVRATVWVVLVGLLCAGRAAGQSVDSGSSDSGSGESVPAESDKEIAVVEVGASASQSLKGGGASFGPDLAVEVTPIENWLELEGGVTPLFNGHSTEWDVDLLFKKPWTLSKKVEFMLCAGPEWVHTREDRVTRNSVALEAVGDFMFWPAFGKHRFGWYLEIGRAHV